MTTHSPAARRPADNPFSGHQVERLAFRRHGFSRKELCNRIQDLGGRAAIVGPKGSGKTTLLEELASAIPGDPVLVRIGGGCHRPWRTARAQLPHPVRPHHAVLVDGAEQLGPVGWRLLLRVARPASYLVVTLHRPGPLPTLIECSADAGLLRDLVAELAPTDAPDLEPGLTDLFDRHDGNIRLCFRELYDVYAGRSTGAVSRQPSAVGLQPLAFSLQPSVDT
jgi:energy-coupling factor transporter ATP-binding protein EcfA2